LKSSLTKLSNNEIINLQEGFSSILYVTGYSVFWPQGNL
jgi:hypothetical protein